MTDSQTAAENSPEWFAQTFYPKATLDIAFESAQVSYTDLDVDLYNSGVNQILSVAASRGHRLYHFCMKDLHWDGGRPAAEMSVLRLDPKWDRSDPLFAHKALRVIARQRVYLDSIQLFVVRGDDIRDEHTENVELLRWASEHAKVLETVDATVNTTDKYKPLERAPQLPHPVTFPATTLAEVHEALPKLPQESGYFVLKDRFGYGCGVQVHRIRFDAPDLDQRLAGYLKEYGWVIVQEFCAEVGNGDLVVTFFDDELIAAMRRLPPEDDWKTNASAGAREVGVNLTPQQEAIARAMKRSFPECRLASIDMLESGKILEINAFPGAKGLLKNYGIALGEIVIDRMEAELLGTGADESAPAAMSWDAEVAATFPTGTQFLEPDELYAAHGGEREVFDVFSGDTYKMGVRELIPFEPHSPEYIISVPHAGVFVPQKFRDRFKIDEKSLLELDLYSDLLYETFEGLHLRSEFTPFFVDMNRDRAGSNDGQVPHHLKNPPHEYYNIKDEPMLQRPYAEDEADEVLEYYDLYHDLLAALIRRMKRERGYAVVFDCHSMTSTGLGRVADKGEARANFVVGTLGGTSARGEILDAFINTLQKEATQYGLGMTVATDVPYSGGFITRKHHDPANNVHVIQIEVSMDTYMYEATDETMKRYAIKKPRLKIVRDVVRAAFRSACAAAEQAHAAEPPTLPAEG